MNENPRPSGSEIVSRNPATAQVLRRFEPHSDQEVEKRLQRAVETFGRFRRLAVSERAHWLERVASILEKEKAELGRLMTMEMGKPIRAAVQEAEKCAQGCRFYVQNGERFLAREPVSVHQGTGYVRFDPLGPVLAVMPWNFPFWQVFRFAAPALVAGNVALLKHASNVPQCALAIEDIFRRAGFPEGSFQTLLIGSGRVQKIIEDRRISAVTLTGSVEAGARVASVAGGQIKKTVLELGGSDPFIVMPSANLAEAAATAVRARTINNGQSCIAAKRFILDRRIAADFERLFVERMSKLKVGDPMDDATDVGPLATEEEMMGLQLQVDKSISMGAKLLLGGKRLDRLGYFFAPTVLSDLPSDSPPYQEELFGPVASLFQADGLEEAIRIANDTRFGLGASAWTNDESEATEFSERLEAGLVFINGMVASHPALPFGGIKQSGYGRELSHYGIREFVNIKTVVRGVISETSSAAE
jgi:succinate-semialdehyde dehydrogenase/glutarate-semialdehyde dehydrogenase